MSYDSWVIEELLAAQEELKVAQAMVKSTYPRMKALKDLLEPIEREYARWSNRAWYLDRRIAELNRLTRVTVESKRLAAAKRRSETPEELLKKMEKISFDEREKLIKDLEELEKEK